MSAYRTVLITQIDDNQVTIEFDTIDDVSTQLTSTVTTHPIVNGDTIADHMYKDPISISISGSYSLNGRKRMNITSDNRLGDIQNIIERIKNDALFCTIVTISDDKEQKQRFKSRSNMILNSISWREKQNSMDFALGFVEALTAEVQTIDYQVDVNDPLLPALTEPNTLSFTETLLDWEKIYEMTISILSDFGLISMEFLQMAGTAIGGVAVAGLGVALGYVLVSVVAAGTIPGIGWIVSAAGLVVVGVVMIWNAFANFFNKQKFKIEAFKKYNDDRKNQAEVERFANFVGTIHQQLMQLENITRVYQITSNENQECMMSIDNSYYVFKFMKNSSTGFYGLTIHDSEDKPVKTFPTIAPLEGLSECKNNNYIMRTSPSGHYVYLLNLKLFEANQNGWSKSQVDEVLKDISNCVIFITQVDMEEFNNLVVDIIKNAIKA